MAYRGRSDDDDDSDTEAVIDVDASEYGNTEEYINISIDKLLQNTHYPCVTKRNGFFNNPRHIIEEKRSPLTNITDQQTFKCYHVSDVEVPEALDLLEECRKNNIFSGFAERQNEISGMMIDLDLLSKKKESYLNDTLFQRITQYIVDSLMKFIKFKREEEIYVVFIRKKTIKYSDKHEAYKDGIHILLPGLKVSKQFKKYFIKKHLIDDNGIGEILKNTEYINKDTCVDPNSAGVFVLFLGNCKEGSVPYDLSTVYQVTIYDRGASPIVKDWTEKFTKSDNLIHELSINWERPGGIIKKKQYNCRSDFENEINTWAEQSKDNIIDEEEIESNKNSMSMLCLQDPDALYYKGLLEIVDQEKATDRNMWYTVVCIFRNMGNEQYKKLVYYFSQRCPQKYTKEAVDQLWDEVGAKKHENPATIRRLEQWAKEDAPQKFEELKNTGAMEILYKAVYEYGGDIRDAIVADILSVLFRGKYIVDFIGGKSKEPQFYEFMTPDDKKKPGEEFKYKHMPRLVQMKKYIHKILPRLYDRMLKYVKDKAKNEVDPNMQKYHEGIRKKLVASKIKLTDDSFKNKVLNGAADAFYEPNFLAKLDLDPDIIGVGNGVLKLAKKVKLIHCFHEYYISRYTPVIYRPFDPKNSIIKKILNALRLIIVEEDAFEWIMTYMAMALDGHIKDSAILLLVGEGSNGKSFLLELFTNTLGELYARKLPLTTLTGQRPSAEKANPSLYELKYARAVYYSEANACASINVGALKEMLGQEKLSVRQNYGEQENIRPHCIHISTSNYDYEIECTDWGTWRRIYYYRCKMKFDANPEPGNKFETKADPDLGKHFTTNPLAQEAMMSILVHYYEQYQNKYGASLSKVQCPTIRYETQCFRNRQDYINEFICQKILKTSKKREELHSLTQLAEMFETWFMANKRKTALLRKQIISELSNSILSKYIRKDENTEVFMLHGHRIREDMDVLTEDDKSYYETKNETKYENGEFNNKAPVEEKSEDSEFDEDEDSEERRDRKAKKKEKARIKEARQAAEEYQAKKEKELEEKLKEVNIDNLLSNITLNSDMTDLINTEVVKFSSSSKSEKHKSRDVSDAWDDESDDAFESESDDPWDEEVSSHKKSSSTSSTNTPPKSSNENSQSEDSWGEDSQSEDDETTLEIDKIDMQKLIETEYVETEGRKRAKLVRSREIRNIKEKNVTDDDEY